MKVQEIFQDWELRHLARRAEQFGLSQHLVQNLRICGWKLTKGKKLLPDQSNSLRVVLTRLASIPRFVKTCDKEHCETCNKLVELLRPRASIFVGEGEEWKLNLELWRWQKECIQKWWENNGRGIVKVVTGAGKTILALALIEQLKNKRAYKKGNLRIFIVVPTMALLEQWEDEIKDKLSLEKEVGVYYGEQKDDPGDKDVMIYVVNSARELLPYHGSKETLGPNTDSFLIADECHRFASKVNCNIFSVKYDYTLGLSATPERRADYGFEQILIPNLGNIIYEYSYSDALRDGIIPPFRLKRIAVSLIAPEEQKYEEITERIGKLSRVLISKYPQLKGLKGYDFFKMLGQIQKQQEDEAIISFTALASKRKGIIHESQSKMSCINWIIQRDMPSDARALIFHERTQIADRIYKYLVSQGFKGTIYHSNMDMETRKTNLREYKRGKSSVLVTCRALDEGLDVPDTSVGIIAAATSSIRQRIQRIGRILRRAPGKDYSLIYTIFIEGLEDDIFRKTEMIDLQTAAQKIEYLKLSL
jgi:superfamily II DNA or RNA helicase